MGLKENFYRRSARVGGLARSVAIAYRTLREQHPEFSHPQLMSAVLAQRSEIHSQLVGGYDSFGLARANRLTEDGAVALSDPAYALAQMENPAVFNLLHWDDRNRILQVISEEIIDTLGNDPPN